MTALLFEKGVVVAAARRSGHGGADGRLQLGHRACVPGRDVAMPDYGLHRRDRPGRLRTQLDVDRRGVGPEQAAQRFALRDDLVAELVIANHEA